jgi:hypothetical protein
LEHVSKAKEIDPAYEINYLALFVYLAKGMEQEAFRLLLSQLESEQASDDLLVQYLQAFRQSGMQGVHRLRREYAAVRFKSQHFDLAGYYALAGEGDLAFASLRRVYEGPCWLPFFADARFDSLRSDPRFEALLRKLNLPEEAIQRHLALR